MVAPFANARETELSGPVKITVPCWITSSLAKFFGVPPFVLAVTSPLTFTMWIGAGLKLPEASVWAASGAERATERERAVSAAIEK